MHMKRLLSIVIIIVLTTSFSLVETRAENTLNIYIGSPYGVVKSMYGRVFGFMGDANSDGHISILDATTVQFYVAQLFHLSEDSKLISDVNNDASISVLDATEIQMWLAQLSVNKNISCVVYSDKIAAPVITSAELNEDNTVTLTWDKSDGAYQYRVFVKSGSKWKGVAYTKSNTYTIENLKNNIEYTYTVRCCDKDKNYTSDYVRSNCTFTRNLIVDQEAYTEETLLYEQVTRGICNKCGKDITEDITDTNSEYYGMTGYEYHNYVDNCWSAWHTETKWYNKVENRLATIEESDSANNPYLYNETHRDKLERRYKYSAVCTNSECPDYAKTLFSVTSLYLDSNIKTELRNLLDAHYNENHPTEDTQQGQIDSHQEVWQITSYPEISHYELTVK